MKILNSKEIMEKLKVGKSTLYQLLKDPDFPTYKIGRNTLYELLKDPDFPTYKIGKKYYATEEEIENWIISKQSK